jgi:hypothetical protein
LKFRIVREGSTFTVLGMGWDLSVGGFPDHSSAASWVMEYLLRILEAAQRKDNVNRWMAPPVVLDQPTSEPAQDKGHLA